MTKNLTGSVNISVVYDFIFIGTGVIPTLEAIYQSHLGNTVLMIDRNNKLGGAWAPLELFGFRDVENAIHYFLHEPRAIYFMRDILDWPISPVSGKYRIFNNSVFGLKRLPYDQPLSKLIAEIESAKSFGQLLSSLCSFFQSIGPRKKKRSQYIDGGAIEMIRRLQVMLASSSVEALWSTEIESISLNTKTDLVSITTSSDTSKKIYCKCICFSHGSKIKRLFKDKKLIPVGYQHHPRPSVHLLVLDNYESQILEGVFCNDSLIKYAHNVTRYSKEEPFGLDGKKIIIVALKHGVENTLDVYDSIFIKLKEAQIIGANALLIDHYWQDIALPSLSDEDLCHLKKNFDTNCLLLSSENFTKGLALRANAWAEVFDNKSKGNLS
jgi:hypothetical protein